MPELMALTSAVQDWDHTKLWGGLGAGGMGEVYRAKDIRLEEM
jgi:hypothetical protein